MNRAGVAVVAVLMLSGCGVGAGETPDDVTLRVTDDFGGRVVLQEDRPTIEGEDTVMRLLRRNAEVGTAYGGAFVTSIGDRRSGDRAGSGTQDWVYLVDGVLAERGATAVRVRDGDRVWWDRQDTRLTTVGAVVGSFPAPLRGTAPLDVACADVRAASCRTAASRLRAAGIRTAVRAVADPAPAGPPVRLVVGPWAGVRRAAGAAPFGEGPRASGVFAVPVRGGLAAYDRAGNAGPRLRDWAVVAATRPRGEPVTWLVTGRTESDATAAAAALREPVLRGRFALLLTDGRPSSLPVPRR